MEPNHLVEKCYESLLIEVKRKGIVRSPLRSLRPSLLLILKSSGKEVFEKGVPHSLSFMKNFGAELYVLI